MDEKAQEQEASVDAYASHKAREASTESEAVMNPVIRFTIACILGGVSFGYALHKIERRRGSCITSP